MRAFDTFRPSQLSNHLVTLGLIDQSVNVQSHPTFLPWFLFNYFVQTTRLRELYEVSTIRTRSTRQLQSPWERRHLACVRQAGSLRTQEQARCLRSQGGFNSYPFWTMQFSWQDQPGTGIELKANCFMVLITFPYNRYIPFKLHVNQVNSFFSFNP